jgi:hypothetical protein
MACRRSDRAGYGPRFAPSSVIALDARNAQFCRKPNDPVDSAQVSDQLNSAIYRRERRVPVASQFQRLLSRTQLALT